jgi:hypothetical protein
VIADSGKRRQAQRLSFRIVGPCANCRCAAVLQNDFVSRPAERDGGAKVALLRTLAQEIEVTGVFMSDAAKGQCLPAPMATLIRFAS